MSARRGQQASFPFSWRPRNLFYVYVFYSWFKRPKVSYDLPIKDSGWKIQRRPVILLVFSHSSWFCMHKVIYFIFCRMTYTIHTIPHNIHCCAITANKDATDVLLPVRTWNSNETQNPGSCLFKVAGWLQCFRNIHWCIDLYTFLQIYIIKSNHNLPH